MFPAGPQLDHNSLNYKIIKYNISKAGFYLFSGIKEQNGPVIWARTLRSLSHLEEHLPQQKHFKHILRMPRLIMKPAKKETAQK
jgi:hypothetical protein